MKPKQLVLCLGNIAFDLVEKKGKPFPFLFDALPGGSVLNTSIILSKLGIKVGLIAKTSSDSLGDALLDLIENQKIDTSLIVQDKNLQAGLAFAFLDKKGDSSYVFYKSASREQELTKEQKSLSIIKKASVLHTGSAYSYSDMTYTDTLFLLKTAYKNNVFTTYDPNWRPKRLSYVSKAKKRIFSLFRYVSLLKLSETDALGITNKKTLSSAIQFLPKNTVITLGKNGSFFWDGNKKIYAESFKVKVKDTIGAGDAFTAGLIYKYTKDPETFYENIKENLNFASKISSIICTGSGATGALGKINYREK